MPTEFIICVDLTTLLGVAGKAVYKKDENLSIVLFL